jgi:hypothetical protein
MTTKRKPAKKRSGRQGRQEGGKPPTKRKTGRPSSFTQKTADLICALLSEGQSLRRICESASMPSKQTVLKWLASPERAEFLAQYARAREEQADFYAEEIIEISDETSHDTKLDGDGNERQDTEWISRSKLRVNTRQWLMARMAPKKYGDKITTELKGNLTLSHEDALDRLDDA